jgi:hypothetical protein
MHRYNVLIVGLFMVGAGAYLIFANPQTLPLWFVWLTGPFLWYLGIALSISGLAMALFMPRVPQQQQAQTKNQKQPADITILHLKKLAVEGAPAGLTREVPAMGGFIL